jgi:hypothetical protein
MIFLVCSTIALAGCQHPLAPSFPAPEPAAAYTPPQTEACALELGLPEIPKPEEQPPMAAVEKKPECLTGQAGDAFLLVLKTFTGR